MAVTRQFTVMIENKRGSLAEVCSKLAEKAVNILGLLVPDQPGVAPVRLVVNSAGRASIRSSAPSSEIILPVLVDGSVLSGGQVPPYIYSALHRGHEGDF